MSPFSFMYSYYKSTTPTDTTSEILSSLRLLKADNPSSHHFNNTNLYTVNFI